MGKLILEVGLDKADKLYGNSFTFPESRFKILGRQTSLYYCFQVFSISVIASILVALCGMKKLNVHVTIQTQHRLTLSERLWDVLSTLKVLFYF